VVIEDAIPEPHALPTSALYVEAVESFIAFARTLSDEQWLTPVPCLPGWDARDVLSHVAGIPDDAFAGRMEGAPGEAWTASQVERNRDFTVEHLLAQWTEQYVGFGEVLDGIGEHRPPFDCHAHEHDIRHALGLAGNRAFLVVEVGAQTMATGHELAFPVTVHFDDGRSFISGADDAASEGVSVSGLTPFEVFRSGLGRRSRQQVEVYNWVGDVDQIAEAIDSWFSFGPAAGPINE
jgi:uncharacterized protein (TIGR03083 family)